MPMIRWRVVCAFLLMMLSRSRSAARFRSDWSSMREDVEKARSTLSCASVLHKRLISVEGVRVWGCSYVPRAGLPTKTAFNLEPDELRDAWAQMPECDVLLTHAPAMGAGDRNMTGKRGSSCPELRKAIAAQEHPPRFHCFGHVHTDWGAYTIPEDGTGTIHINAASVSDYFVLRKKAPIVFDVPIPHSAI